MVDGRFLSPLTLNLPKGITAASISLALYYSIKKGTVKVPLFWLSDLISEVVSNSQLTREVDDVIATGVFVSDARDLSIDGSCVSNLERSTNLT